MGSLACGGGEEEQPRDDNRNADGARQAPHPASAVDGIALLCRLLRPRHRLVRHHQRSTCLPRAAPPSTVDGSRRTLRKNKASAEDAESRADFTSYLRACAGGSVAAGACPCALVLLLVVL